MLLSGDSGIEIPLKAEVLERRLSKSVCCEGGSTDAGPDRWLAFTRGVVSFGLSIAVLLVGDGVGTLALVLGPRTVSNVQLGKSSSSSSLDLGHTGGKGE